MHSAASLGPNSTCSCVVGVKNLQGAANRWERIFFPKYIRNFRCYNTVVPRDNCCGGGSKITKHGTVYAEKRSCFLSHVSMPIAHRVQSCYGKSFCLVCNALVLYQNESTCRHSFHRMVRHDCSLL